VHGKTSLPLVYFGNQQSRGARLLFEMNCRLLILDDEERTRSTWEYRPK